MSGSLRIVPSLLSKLSRVIGPESAATELRWMKQTLADPPSGIPPSASTLEDMVARRVAGEPLQYILGSQPFGSLNIAVRPPVLIPRPETEDWTIRLSETMSPTGDRPLSMLDLCTGTGCIPLLLCHLWPPGSVHATGIDISAAAVQLANENARLCGLAASPNAPARTANGHRAPPNSMRQSSLQTPMASALAPGSPSTSRANANAHAEMAMAATPKPDGDSDDSPRTPNGNGKSTRNTFTAVLADLMSRDFTKHACLRPPYDLITANPPYIPQAEYDALCASVRDYEDVRALLGDPVPIPVPAPPRSSASPRAGAAWERDVDADTDEDEDADEGELPASDRGKGLTFYHRIAALAAAPTLLRAGGTLALEVGDGQAPAVAALVARTRRFAAVDVWTDPWGKARAVVGRGWATG